MNKTNNDATFIDVRTPAEYADEHFPNAINIPLDELHSRINEIKNLKNTHSGILQKR